MKKLLILLLLLGVAGSAWAANTWNTGNTTTDWFTASNWSLGNVPDSGSTNGNVMLSTTTGSAPGPVILSGENAVAYAVEVSGPSTGTPVQTLTIKSGATLTIGTYLLVSTPDGTTRHGDLIVEGGTVNIGTELSVGRSSSTVSKQVDDRGWLHMTGGTINITGSFYIARWPQASGWVYLWGGTINAPSFDMLPNGGTGTASMDITTGTLIVNGDVSTKIAGYIASGWITAYGGDSTLSVDYNVRNAGKTTVTANSPEKASSPTPADGATGTNIDADLSWTAGIYATSHDVYFGTDSTPDETEFKGNQTETTFEPNTLAPSTTYYWVIDEVNLSNPNSPWIGDVWSFTTQTSTATLKKGPYLIYPGNNAEMTVLWQLDSSETCTLAWGLDTTYSTGSANVPEYGTDHQYKHTITALTPGTKYYYKVTVGTGVTTGSFRAAPATSATSVKFFMYGDTRTNIAWHDSVCARMIDAYTADTAYQTIALHSGDWVERGNEPNQTNQWWNYAYTNLMDNVRSLAYAGCMGNHEDDGSVWAKYWPFPFVASPRYYYSFDYGPVHVTVLDQFTTYTDPSAQYTWLVNDLSASTKPWKIIVLHQPGWSAGSYHANNTTVQTVIQPLCLTYGVQIVVAGDNHYYSRADVSGVQHLTSGGGGAPLYTPEDGQPYIVTYSYGLSFQKVAIDGNTLTCDTIKQSDGTVVDTFTLTYTPPPPPPIFSDGFESGGFTAGGWTKQNTNATVSTKAKYTGAYGAKLAKTTWIQKAVSTAGYNTIHVKYARETYGLDAGENLYVEWSIDGSAWNNLETTQATAWASQDFTCGSGANNNANFRVRWRTNASATQEYAYVDDVVITGTAQ